MSLLKKIFTAVRGGAREAGEANWYTKSLHFTGNSWAVYL